MGWTSYWQGRRGEEMAVEYLKKEGFQILERNWRVAGGEIDIIAVKDGVIHFVEVKSGKIGKNRPSPLFRIDRRKFQRIQKSALYYLHRHGLTRTPFLFDGIEVDLEQKKVTLYPLSF
jgi:putative endonuclease